MKYIVILGGTLSGIGKGVTGSSIAFLLKKIGMKPTYIKIDSYINVDSGNLSPLEHGEVFVLSDGSEVDLDFGIYERILNVSFTGEHSMTTGKLYDYIIKKERKGGFNGETVQTHHLVDFIKDKIKAVSTMPLETNLNGKKTSYVPDICMVELGGTVEDSETLPFRKALSELREEFGKENFIVLSVDILLKLKNNEVKTKLVQRSVEALKKHQLMPNLLVLNTTFDIDTKIIKKISNLTRIDESAVFLSPQLEDISDLPKVFAKQNLHEKIVALLNLTKKNEIKEEDILLKCLDFKKRVKIGIVGKYSEQKDSYLSVIKALEISGNFLKTKVEIELINTDDITNDVNIDSILKSCDGIVVPGGFGKRGIEEKIETIKYARENNIPFLGICLGFQCTVIEFCRNVLGIKDATSEEFDNNAKDMVIKYMVDDANNIGTMRLGDRKTFFKGSSNVRNLYDGLEYIIERHRHRYEVNQKYLNKIQKAGMSFVATDESEKRMEILEIPELRYFIGTQYHPELTARINSSNKIFDGLVKSAYEHLLDKENML